MSCDPASTHDVKLLPRSTGPPERGYSGHWLFLRHYIIVCHQVNEISEVFP